MMKKVFWILLFFFVELFSCSESVYVKRVVDGDTLELEDGRKIRLIGVDTPELHVSQKLYRDSDRSGQDIAAIRELGLRACAFTKKYLDKQRVDLEYESSNRVTNHQDKYGRTLAYVYVQLSRFPPEYEVYLSKKKENKKKRKKDYYVLFNRLLIQCGYANAYTRFPFEYLEDFRMCEREARTFETGLWKLVEQEGSKPPVVARMKIRK